MQGVLDWLVVELAFELLALEQFAHGLHEVLVDDIVALGAYGEHARLGAHVAQVGAVEAVGELDNGLEVDVAALGNRRRVDLHDVQAALLVGQRDLDLAIQTTRTQQGRIQRVRSIRGHDHLHFAERVEAVHLVEQLHERALNLAIGRRALREAATANRVNLVHEYDARLVVARECEHLADHARRLADVLVDNGAGDHLEEAAVELTGDRTCQQRLAGAGRSVEQTSLGRCDADTQEELGIEQRKLDDLAQLADLLLETSDFGVAHVARILVRHVVDERIDLAWQIAHNSERGHVECDTRAGLQLCLVQLATAADYVTRSIRCLYDNCFVFCLQKCEYRNPEKIIN